jgi:hypothetical protein
MLSAPPAARKGRANAARRFAAQGAEATKDTETPGHRSDFLFLPVSRRLTYGDF